MIKDNKIKILVAGHKNVPVLTNNIYLPIHVGAKIADKKFASPWVGDDTGDNISDKNKEYCELTGLYWAWKNLKDVDYIGLCHYRRYFYPINSNFKNFFRKSFVFIMHLIANFLPQKFSGEYPFQNMDNIFLKSIDVIRLDNKLISEIEKSDIILPKKMHFSKLSIFEQFSTCQNVFDFESAIDVLVNDFGYEKKELKKITKSRKLTTYNMMIMKKYIFNEYCEWLFSVLSKVELRISYEKRNVYQKRVVGILAERLLHIWIELNKNRFKINRIKTAFINDYL